MLEVEVAQWRGGAMIKSIEGIDDGRARVTEGGNPGWPIIERGCSVGGKGNLTPRPIIERGRCFLGGERESNLRQLIR